MSITHRHIIVKCKENDYAAKYFSEIAEVQSNSVDQVIDTISSIKKISEQTISNAHKSSRQCHEILSQGAKLKEMVGKFKL